MKKPAFRWLEAIGIPAFVCAVLFFGTGCGALKAAANPKVAWAMNDPAPMSVVVRRADVAEKTAQNVDRLMTETPVNDDSPWLAKVAPDKEAQSKDFADLQAHDLYNPPGAKIVAAEVWAKELNALEPKDPKAAPAAPAAVQPAAVASKDSKDHKDGKKESSDKKEAASKDEKPAAVAEAEPAPEPVKGKGKGKGKGKKAKGGSAAVADSSSASAPKKGGKGGKKAKKGAPADDATLASNDANAKPAEKAASKDVKDGKEPVGTTTTTSATAPASTTNAKYTSILAAIDKDLAAEWAKVMEKKKAMGEVKTQIAALEAANDAKGISDADKKANKDKIGTLEKQFDALEKEAKQMQKDFVPKAKAAAAKAPQDVRDHFGPTLVHLRQAVDDANTSNSAALIRYPMAASTLLDSAQTMAKVYVADVIEEQTGKRPSTQGVTPGVTMEGGDVKVTLNGLSSSDMGKISMGDLTTEVAKRTGLWAKRALGLVGTIAATKEILDFEDEVLGNIIDGFKSAGWAAPAPATIPEPAPAAGGQPKA